MSSMSGSMVFCADVSNWQGNVDMSSWRGMNIHGCIAKALEGQTGVDVQWAANRRKLAALAGPDFVPGAYHYLNHVHPAADQCKAFLDMVPGDWIHGFDVEAPGPLDVDGWFREYRRHYPNKVVALYTNIGMWKNRSNVRVFDVNAAYGPVELWVAGAYPGQYQAGKDDFRAIWGRVPAGADGGLPFLGFTSYALMQYSGSATVPGVPSAGNCDMNVAGSLDVLKRLASPNGGTDDMSQADVDAIKAYIDQKVGGVPAAVWAAPLGSDWDGTKPPASALLASAQRYAIEAGFPGDRPKGNGNPGTPTYAKQVLAAVTQTVTQTDTLEASEASQSQALADAVKNITDGVVSQLLGSGIVGIDEPKLRTVVGAAVHDQLVATKFVAQPTTTT